MYNKTIKITKFFMVLMTISITFCTAINLYYSAWYIIWDPEFIAVQWDGSIDESFDDSSFLIVLNEIETEINKVHEIDTLFYGRPAIISALEGAVVYDLTYIHGDINDDLLIDKKLFRQILQIQLPFNCKQTVFDLIHKCTNPFKFIWVGPNHFGTPFTLPPSSSGVLYPSQWGIHGLYGIMAPEAWGITTGINNRIRVGVIDSGMNRHQDFIGNISALGGDFFLHNNGLPGPLRTDIVGQGTRMAGIIGANGNSLNGVVGVNRNVELVPMQIATTSVVPNPWGVGPHGYFQDVASTVRAINYAQQNGIKILNLSTGWPNENLALRNAIINYTGLLVAAAGNKSQMGNFVKAFPAVYANQSVAAYNLFSHRIISVGGINQNGTVWSDSVVDSNHVNVLAPAQNIWTTSVNNGFDLVSGTSTATAFVSGIASLMLSANPNLTPTQLKYMIAINTDGTYVNNINVLGGTCSSNGRVNAFHALSGVVFQTALTNNGISITGIIPNFTFAQGTNLTLPSHFNPGLSTKLVVDTITGSVFSNNQRIVQIKIPNTITNIPASSFLNTNPNLRINFINRDDLNNTNISVNFNPNNRIVQFNNINCPHSMFTNIGNNLQRCNACYFTSLFHLCQWNSMSNVFIQFGYQFGVWRHIEICPWGSQQVDWCLGGLDPSGSFFRCIFCDQLMN